MSGPAVEYLPPSPNSLHRRALDGMVSSILASGVDPAILSAGELLLLQEIARGHSNRDIARLTGRAPSEVLTAVQSLLETLAIAGRAQAVLYAVIHKLIPAEEVPALSAPAERVGRLAV